MEANLVSIHTLPELEFIIRNLKKGVLSFFLLYCTFSSKLYCCWKPEIKWNYLKSEFNLYTTGYPLVVHFKEYNKHKNNLFQTEEVREFAIFLYNYRRIKNITLNQGKKKEQDYTVCN